MPAAAAGGEELEVAAAAMMGSSAKFLTSKVGLVTSWFRHVEVRQVLRSWSKEQEHAVAAETGERVRVWVHVRILYRRKDKTSNTTGLVHRHPQT